MFILSHVSCIKSQSKENGDQLQNLRKAEENPQWQRENWYEREE